MIKIKQTVERVGAAEYKAIIEVDGEVTETTFERSNEIYPAYKSLIIVLRNYYNEDILLETNSKQLKTELTSRLNLNTTLYNIYADTIAKNGLTVEIDG